VVGNTTFPPKETFTKENGPFDILTVSGMVLDGKVHAHITLALQRKRSAATSSGNIRVHLCDITLGILSDAADLTKVDDYNWR